MLGTKGILTSPGISLGISIGSMELAIDYLQNASEYEPDLTDIKTAISNKRVVNQVKREVVKPKLSRENIINKYNLFDNSVKLKEDTTISESVIVEEVDDFDFSFDTPAIEQDIDDIVDNKIDCDSSISQAMAMQNLIDTAEDEDVGFELNMDEIEFEDEELEDEYDYIEDESEESTDIANIDELDMETQSEDSQSEINTVVDADFADLEDANDDYCEEETYGLDDEYIELFDEDETDEINIPDIEDISDNTESNQVDDITDKKDKIIASNEELERQIKEEQKQAELLKELSRLKDENNKLREKSKESTPELSSDKKLNNSGNKSYIDSLGNKEVKPVKSDIAGSKYDKYTAMNIDTLYKTVKTFMLKLGVKEHTIDIKELNEEFGADNIRKLIVKQYIIKTSKGVTVGI